MSVGASLMNVPESGDRGDLLDVSDAPNSAEKHRRYRAMVERLRELVARTLPPAARVAVISKGDDDLLRLGDRIASHFPRDPRGGYAGYHPSSGVHALEMLRASRAEGVEFVVVPATSLWWRETYEEFREYLATRYRLIVEEDGTGAVYELLPRPAAEPEPPPDEEARQIQELVRAVLPNGARIAVLGDGAGARCAYDSWTPAGLNAPRATAELLQAALEGLELIHRTADYLVVTAPDSPPSPLRDELLAAIGERMPPVVEHRDVCSVFDVRDRNGVARAADRSAARDANVKIGQVVRLLLPRGAAVVLAGSDHETCAVLGDMRLVRVVLDAELDAEAFLARLESWRSGGIAYLVVTPRSLRDADGSGDARAGLDQRYACRWSDPDCLVYDLMTSRRRKRRRPTNGRGAR